jgi:hypothetical protein
MAAVETSLIPDLTEARSLVIRVFKVAAILARAPGAAEDAQRASANRPEKCSGVEMRYRERADYASRHE